MERTKHMKNKNGIVFGDKKEIERGGRNISRKLKIQTKYMKKKG